jgi:hypothetical protein
METQRASNLAMLRIGDARIPGLRHRHHGGIRARGRGRTGGVGLTLTFPRRTASHAPESRLI